MKFSSTFNTSVQRCLYPYFKISASILCRFIFFEECLNPQVRINKMVNEHTVDYHPSPSEFTSWIHPLIFLWTPKEFISAEYFLNFFSNLYIPPWLQESFKFMVLRLLENTFVSQKTEFVPQAKLSPRFLSSPLQAKEITHSPQTKCFENLFFISRQGKDYRAENMIKIKLAMVLVTNFDKFHHLQHSHYCLLFCCAII